MRIVNLMENTPGVEGCVWEHGLSFYIETEKHKILVDTGASGAFVDNAVTLGIDLKAVDTLILSHGHYDHAGGILRFVAINPEAKIYMQGSALEGYYHLYQKENGWDAKYIGVDRAAIQALPQLCLLQGDIILDDELRIFTGVTGRELWPRSNKGLVLATDVDFVQDEFAHEQYLVIHAEGKYILVSGCAHNGVLNILKRYQELFDAVPDVMISGFHMMNKKGYTEEDWAVITETALRLRDIPTVFFTGHCTGEAPFARLQAVMGEQVQYVRCGETVELM